MHELSLATSIIETIRGESRKRPESRIVKVGLRIGELAGIDPNALEFSFDILIKDTDLAPLEVEMERMPRRHLCPTCSREFIVDDYETDCPDCGDPRTTLISGDELEIAWLEVEES